MGGGEGSHVHLFYFPVTHMCICIVLVCMYVHMYILYKNMYVHNYLRTKKYYYLITSRHFYDMY